jgi:hypothetical protein
VCGCICVWLHERITQIYFFELCVACLPQILRENILFFPNEEQNWKASSIIDFF